MTTAETAALPFNFFPLQVVATRRLGPSLVRVTFTGAGDEDLSGFASGGRDQSLSLFLPHPGQPEPVLPPVVDGDLYGALGAWRAMPDDVRAVMRSYTVREQRRTADGATEVDIDFAVHEDGGPACRWALAASEGDRVAVLGPAVADNTGVRFQLPEDADEVLMWGDETALPAASAILEWLPAGTRAQVWLEVPRAGDRLELRTAADATVTWLVREEGAPPAVDAVRAAEVSGAAPYVWLAGESGSVKALRRHFVNERGFDRRRVTFVGYWRKGVSEDALRETPDADAEA
ncbi:siderophore-interacting protein [Streptomyces thermolilacinus]|uniref:NADPH-dependent ferric siderophore reductase n=1 Tax=Streptomyces thermolilacinus SPC6 TaxID=1306406 RepID=A0A1D3DV18_9ACTN|nr:siderophore-interacting protein [Streptomyces thermolilacinus]OEJ96168.1 NADPH-dependent ferric siderophore reductase [Streptomyces thermolilacinus SPC6]